MGTGRATGVDQWASALRTRFHEVARRRLPPDLVEDVVQEALRVVVEKRIAVTTDVEAPPSLAWCFQVLRHTIGNAYRRQRRRENREAGPETMERGTKATADPTPLEALEAREARGAIERALASLARSDQECARMLTRVVEGSSPAEIASQGGTDPLVFYRRSYRCRQKLRALLLQEGVDV
jgi:RNA polymerase sigma factor (sigma-70 family)